MKSTQPSPSAMIRTQHLRSVTLHEICHAFVELHRSKGIRITLEINRFYPFQPHSKFWDGRIEAFILNDEKFRDSVYGWAGMMGDAIEQDRSKAIDLAQEKYKNQRQSVSDSDLAGIESVADHLRPESAQTAYDTLLENWDEIKDIQNRAVKCINENDLKTLIFGWTKKEGWCGLEADG